MAFLTTAPGDSYDSVSLGNTRITTPTLLGFMDPIFKIFIVKLYLNLPALHSCMYFAHVCVCVCACMWVQGQAYVTRMGFSTKLTREVVEISPSVSATTPAGFQNSHLSWSVTGK